MIGQRDPGGIEHLQKEIPYQAVCFVDFIEQENALPVFGKDSSQTSRAAGFIAHEQLDVVQVEELGHVKAENALAPEKIASEFQRQFRLSYSGRAKKKKRPQRFPGGLQAKLAALQHGTYAGNDVALAFDLGRQMRFKAGEIFNEGGSIHGLLAGWNCLPLSHWRTA